MSAGLVASTTTPGRTAPDGSFAVPAITACAKAAVGTITNHARSVRVARILIPHNPVGFPVVPFRASVALDGRVVLPPFSAAWQPIAAGGRRDVYARPRRVSRREV